MSPFRTRWLTVDEWTRAHRPSLLPYLDGAPAAGLRGALDPARARDWARRTLAHRSDLVRDFGGEQLALGRAFYTHLETGRAAEYFRAAHASDALVERTLPGMQAFTIELLALMLGNGARVRRRAGFAGPGVHVFPPGEKVARRGGSIHHDVEGLAPDHVARRAPAYSLVIMLQPPAAPASGGLTLFDATYRGRDRPTQRELQRARTTTTYRAGDALLFSSYRLHQIRGFGGRKARVSITCLCVGVDDGVYDAWF